MRHVPVMNFISFRNIFNLEIENVCHDSTLHWLPLQAQATQPQLQLDMKICGHNQRFSVFIFSSPFSLSLSLSFFLPAGWAKSARNVNYLICLLPRPPLKIVRCTFDKHLWRPVAMWKVQHFLHVHISTWTPLQRGVPKKRKATLMNCWFCWRQHKSSQYYRVRKVNRVCHLVFVSQHILYGKKVKLMILRLLGKQGKWWQQQLISRRKKERKLRRNWDSFVDARGMLKKLQKESTFMWLLMVYYDISV